MRIGFLERTTRGRQVTQKAYKHLGFSPQKPFFPQKDLFKKDKKQEND
jgi:hypothetical protein